MSASGRAGKLKRPKGFAEPPSVATPAKAPPQQDVETACAGRPAAQPANSAARLPANEDLHRGELVPVVELEERGGFVPGEAHWTDAGAEKPVALVELEERLAAGKGEQPPPR